MKQKNEIELNQYPELLKNLDDYHVETLSEEHCKGSLMYVDWIININENNLPDNPEIWGDWATEIFVFDEMNFYPKDACKDIKLYRVEKKIVKKEKWVNVK